ncbi:hypothetical protein [Deinococcus hopiensis]|uniref:Uncharacterized protein n=1 Tax=Deinococcus hopiensis KR-140 TaxID=695939 RepID=A0A1W1VQG1_9DEIO|nr:hypothetical protein [Deinococcus hopiensis]SMB95154.1 hypothetical protein SAMN00790413_02719 [Deinococcus hopiensis KR-140]
MNLRNMMRLARHLATEEDNGGEDGAEGAGGLRAVARRAASAVWQDPRVQDARAELRGRAEELRGATRARVDTRLEHLLEERYGRQGAQPPEAVSALLAARRQEREARATRLRARGALLALAETPEQRRVLSRVVGVTPWAGGEVGELRYTALLDTLAPSGSAEAEMGIHRAIWTLAERQVLAVSPHGRVTACPLPEPKVPLALPERTLPERVLPERAGEG